MKLTRFQEKIIRLIADGRVTSTDSFLIELCREQEPDRKQCKALYEDLINDYIVIGKTDTSVPFVLLPLSKEHAFAYLHEYYSLISFLEKIGLVIKLYSKRHETIKTIECHIVNEGDGYIENATLILREIANWLIVPYQAELNAFIARKYQTITEEELQSEKLHRKAQFCIAITIAFITTLFGIVSSYQNSNKECNVTMKAANYHECSTW